MATRMKVERFMPTPGEEVGVETETDMITLAQTPTNEHKSHRRPARTLHLALTLEMFYLESLLMFSCMSSSFAQ